MSYLYGKTGPTTPPPFTDMLSQEVRIGDTVAYATGRGANACLRVGEVRVLKWHEKMDGGYWEFGVMAQWETSFRSRNDVAQAAYATRISEPSRGRMVRVAKGENW